MFVLYQATIVHICLYCIKQGTGEVVDGFVFEFSSLATGRIGLIYVPCISWWSGGSRHIGVGICFRMGINYTVY